jgi:hypothetical protein
MGAWAGATFGGVMKADVAMNITLPLQPQDEVRLRALARARALPPELIVREALDRVLAEEPEIAAPPAVEAEPDSRPIWEVIVDNMKDVPPDVMDAMPADGASQHDHYIYGWPRREE